VDIGNLISGSSAFSKSSLYIWKFLVLVLLKPSLMEVKEESEKLASNTTFKKQRSWHPVPTLSGK